ncbi:MAG: phospholipid/cholesterol/gamma-HCH transport system substrate-binding protein [Thermoleophilaceae bacterium]|jgi:virulence factor Mce-like protein|nr:phospholipid/cholesterol/gamma-HCH transport system substrate-binding protein [Thermoleophilaceae bacterium]
METRSPHWRRLIGGIGFGFVSIALAILVWQAFGGPLPLAPSGYRVSVALPQASNLFPGADVRISGVNVGDVVAVERNGSSARTTIDIDSRYAPLAADTRAILRTKTLLGEAFLELTPGTPGTPRLTEGAELPASQVQSAEQLDDVLQAFEPATRKRLQSLLGGLSEAFGGREHEFGNSLAAVAPLADDLGTVADQLAAQRGDIRDLVSHGAEVFAALGRRQGALQAAITSGNQVLDVTARNDRALAATVRALPPFLNRLEESTGSVAQASGDLTRAAHALEPAAARLKPAVNQIRARAPEFEKLFDDLPPVLTAGNHGLPGLTRILDSSGPALRQLYPATRELIPVLDVLGLIRGSAVTTLANVAQIHNGTYVGPGNRVINYASGIINAWNETISGWTKRLPTNRGNTYPKPGFLEGIVKHGVLDSYDCRHLGNRAYLPAFGAAPPCREQGPWTFEGKKAYFPRLQRAAP